MSQCKNIYQKLLEIRKSIPYLPKDETGIEFNYVSSPIILSIVREKMDEVGLMLFPNVIDAKVNISSVDNRDKQGITRRTHTYLTELKLEFTWVDAETGETITVPFYSQGVDIGGEKGVGKALTYAEKYFLLKQFNIPTGELDPDSFQEKTNTLTSKLISKEQINELTKLLKELAELRNTSVDNYLVALKINNIEKVTDKQYQEIIQRVESWLHGAKQDKEFAEQKKKATQSKQVENKQNENNVTEMPTKEKTKEVKETQEETKNEKKNDEKVEQQKVEQKEEVTPNKESSEQKQEKEKKNATNAKKINIKGKVKTIELRMKEEKKNDEIEKIPYGLIAFETVDGELVRLIAYGQDKLDLVDQADGIIEVIVQAAEGYQYYLLEDVQGVAA